jgi:hypothetical protein
MTTQSRQEQLARRVVRDAAVTSMFARQLARKPRMKGGLGRNLYVRNAQGNHATDPVSLNRIPVSRAVKVGRQHYDSKTLRTLFQQKARATNPLTRQPFPEAVYKKYGPPQEPRDSRVWSAALRLVERLVQVIMRQPWLHYISGSNISRINFSDVLRTIGQDLDLRIRLAPSTAERTFIFVIGNQSNQSHRESITIIDSVGTLSVAWHRNSRLIKQSIFTL